MMFFHGADKEAPRKSGKDHGESQNSEPKGDGLHHHSIDEDEAGGFHSKHVHPDGREEHDDHATYDEAKSSMDDKFGHADGDDQGHDGDGMDGDDDSMDSQDIAGSYGRAGCE